jgi:chromosomal replication initiation ATPase DnaA
LTDAVVEYWLRRGPRGIDQLLTDLERLDQATLQHKRLLTVPLLKSVLGY